MKIEAHMPPVYLVDPDPTRCTEFSELIRLQGVVVIRFSSLHSLLSSSEFQVPCTIIAHEDFLSGSFTEMARLLKETQARLIFYCTNARSRSKELPQLPQDVDLLIQMMKEESHF